MQVCTIFRVTVGARCWGSGAVSPESECWRLRRPGPACTLITPASRDGRVWGGLLQWTLWTVGPFRFYILYTVGVIKICTLVFRELLSLGCIILKKCLCPSSRGAPEDSASPTTCKVCMIFNQVLTIPKKRCFEIVKDLLVFWTKLSIKIIFGFSLDCHNLIQNLPTYVSWRCFGILRRCT